MSKEKWVVDLNIKDSIWYPEGEYNSEEEAIQEGYKIAKRNKKKTFRVGKIQKCKVPLINPMDIIEYLQEDLYNDYGEIALDYLDDVTEEQAVELGKELSETVEKWSKKNELEPKCFTVSNELVILFK